MIILDTNIASVLLTLDHPDLPLIQRWWEASADHDFRVSVITQAEIAFGLAIMPDGAKKRRLSDAADQFFAAVPESIIPFGSREAVAYGAIMAAQRAQGRPMSVLDAQIAATARVANATLATRNTRHFADCGISLVNPYG